MKAIDFEKFANYFFTFLVKLFANTNSVLIFVLPNAMKRAGKQKNMEQCNHIIAKVDLYRKTGFGTQSMEIFCTENLFTPDTPYPQHIKAEVRFQTLTKEISHKAANQGGYVYRTSHFSASDAHYDHDRKVVVCLAYKFDEKGNRID